MRKFVSIFIMSLLLFGGGISILASEQSTKSPITFKDLNFNHWANNAINFVVSKGIIKGYDDGTFRPNNQVTRAEFVVMLSRAIDKKVIDVQEPFVDVSDNFWGKDEIEIGIALGFINPADYPNKKFEPNKPITRIEMTKMLSKALTLNEDYQNVLNVFKGLYNGDMPFTDWKSINNLDVPHIALIVGTEIVSGYPDGSYGMKKYTNRAETAVMLQRFLKAKEQSPFSYQYINELYEVALTGTNATSISDLKKDQENYTNLQIENENVRFKTKRVYVLPLHSDKTSFFERKFVGDRKNLFKINSNYANKNLIEGVVVTVGDMTFKKDISYYFGFGTSFSTSGVVYFPSIEPMSKYQTDYLVMGQYKDANSQEGSKNEVKEISLYGTWGPNTVGINLSVLNKNTSHPLFFNPNHKYKN